MKRKYICLMALVMVLSGCSAAGEQTSNQDINEQENETAQSASSASEVTGTVTEYTVQDGDELSGGEYVSTTDETSAIEAGGSVSATIVNATITKSDGSASANDANFYGVNSAVRTADKAVLTLKNVTVTSSASNATGVFAYGDSTIYIYDSTVNVDSSGAGGIQVAGGGTLYAYDLTVTSTSKAAIRSDKGGGVLVVDGGTYTCTGSSGAPAIYSTADITVSNATLESTRSRGVIIEGRNSVTLANCTLTGNDQSTKEGSIRANILLYQSTSGDAAEGTSVFSATDCSIISNSGAMFWCTNTSSIINLENVQFTNNDSDVFLIVSAGRWGKDGKNGGSVILNATNQTIEGSITVDDISSLEFNLVNSAFNGSINSDNTDGTVTLTLDESSSWTLTADSYIDEFSGSLDNVITGNYHLYVNGQLVK